MEKHMVDGIRSVLLAATLALAGAVMAAPPPPAAPDAKGELSPDERTRIEKRMAELSTEMSDLGRKLGDDGRMRMVDINRVAMNRAMLGINVDDQESTAKGDGVHVAAVTPRGPAAATGVKSGDVVTVIDGKSLKKDGDATPFQKLRAAMEEKKAGDEVKLKVLREGKALDFTVKAEAYAPRAFGFSFGGPGGPDGLADLSMLLPPGAMAPMQPMGPGSERFRWFTREWGELEMVGLSPKLGEYFGAKEGVLVVHAPSDGAINLQDGDVIVTVGGRKPQSPEQVLRILRSYDAGESLKVEVLRNRKSVTIDAKVPDRRVGGGERGGETFEVEVVPE